MCHSPNIVLPYRVVAFYELLFLLEVITQADLFAESAVKLKSVNVELDGGPKGWRKGQNGEAIEMRTVAQCMF